jgi:hypothetical protein
MKDAFIFLSFANSLYENEFAKLNGFSAASITGGGGLHTLHIINILEIFLILLNFIFINVLNNMLRIKLRIIF